MLIIVFSAFVFAFRSNLVAAQTDAKISVPKVFGEHMVLQRDKEIVVWGWAAEGTKVIVTLAESKTSIRSDETGKWKAVLPAMPAGGPHEMTIAVEGNDPEIVWKDILIGEVWLCSGQSNMAWTVSASNNAKEEIAAADHPMIRHFGVNRDQSIVPKQDFEGTWKVCNPEQVGSFTAVGYYFARKLHKELNVPVGLINSSWGGTRVEPWVPPTGFEQVSALEKLSQQVKLWTPGSKERNSAIKEHMAAMEAWILQAKENDESSSGQPIDLSPAFPENLIIPKTHQSATKLYNAMIHPVVGLPFRGAIWYQGESNHVEGMKYYEKKKALIQGWRKIWGQGDFPFYFVQIAPYSYGNESPTILPTFWEAQQKVTELPNTGMVVVSDIGNTSDIHPRNKQDVGARLAAFALKNDYGKKVIAGGPVFDSMTIGAGELTVKFTNVGEGLKSNNGQPLGHFEVVGKRASFEPAIATIEGDTVVLRSTEVENPVAMRFAWHKLAEPNLVNSAGVPPSAFRAGKVPSPLSVVPDFDQYRVVYDFDFSKLGKRPIYTEDNNKDIGSFDQVAYCLEYRLADQSPKFVFVSMKAFTKDASKIGIPTVASKATFQQPLGPVDIFSNVEGLQTGIGIDGNIEFWPNNYRGENEAKVEGASDDHFDFGDKIGKPRNGYGSMQIHNTQDAQTVFAFNHWGAESKADLGIGNSPEGQPDWTFRGNISDYPTKRLRVFVK